MTLSNQEAPTGQAPAADGLTREILALAAVVVLGSIMTILDATIVNVALPGPPWRHPPRIAPPGSLT